MPLTKHGQRMMGRMTSRYGSRGRQVFYATANSRRHGGKGRIGSKYVERPGGRTRPAPARRSPTRRSR